MRRRAFLTLPVLLATFVLSSLAAPAAGQAPGGEVAVIVHPDVPVDNLSLAELRRILLGDREFWTGGARITLLLHAPVAHERDVAIQKVCEMTEAQFRQHWIAKVFRADTQSAPKIVYSSDAAIDQVSRTPGGLAFVPAGQAPKGVKVLKIDGKAPGQAGYALK